MIRSFIRYASGILVLASMVMLCLQCSSLKRLSPMGWQSLFEKNSDSWDLAGEGSWQFREGQIMANSGTDMGYMYTLTNYDNFELEIEFFPDENVNSGIFIRCQPGVFSATECYEINIWDNHTNQDYRTGAIVTHSTPLALVSTLNQWNVYRIRAIGPRIEAWINDVQVASLENKNLASGHIALQVGNGGHIKFKNARIRRYQ